MSERIVNWHELSGQELDFFSDNPFAEEIQMFKWATEYIKTWVGRHHKLIVSAGLLGLACIV